MQSLKQIQENKGIPEKNMYCNRVTLAPTYRKEVALSSSTLRSLEESKLMVKITNLHLPSSQKHADKLGKAV